MLYFCTYFDSYYLVRFLAMCRSLLRHCEDKFELFALCFDGESERVLAALRLPGVRAIPLADFERDDKELLAVKSSRAGVEYYFTCTPSLPLYVLRNYSYVDMVAYLDADLYFYSSPRPIFEEMAENSILIIPHRFAPGAEEREKYGVYNVAFLVFRRDDNAGACLEWWRARCLEWCFDRVEDGKFADQKYLDEWPKRFNKVCELQHKGADLASWNVCRHNISVTGGNVKVDGAPLIFYHFEGYRQESRSLIDPGLGHGGRKIPCKVIKAIHVPYVNEILKCRRILAAVGARGAGVKGSTRKERHAPDASLSRRYAFRCFLEGKYVWCFLGRAWYCDAEIPRAIVRLYDLIACRFPKT